MEMKSLDRRIAMVSQRVKNINLGGCGIFAFELYKILRFEFGIETEIAFSGYRAGKQICFDHILLVLRNPDPGHAAAWIDSRGVSYSEPRGGFRNYMTPFELEELIEDKSLWNKAFHFHFQDAYFNTISNENFLRRQMYNYISDRIT